MIALAENDTRETCVIKIPPGFPKAVRILSSVPGRIRVARAFVDD